MVSDFLTVHIKFDAECQETFSKVKMPTRIYGKSRPPPGLAIAGVRLNAKRRIVLAPKFAHLGYPRTVVFTKPAR